MTMRRPGTRCARRSPRSTTASQLIARLDRRDGSVIDCATVPLPDGATLVDLPRRHRYDQRRARAAREERGAGDRRRDQDRFRPSRLLRAALAADQHHRLCAFPRRPGDRPADRQAARISRLHHHLHQRAAGDHQQHPRPRHHRRRRHDAQPRAGGYPQHHAGGGRRHPGPAGEGRAHARHARGARCRQLHRRREARAAGAVQPARQRRELLAAGRRHHADRRAAARCRGVLGDRSRPGDSGRGAEPGVRLVRDAIRWARITAAPGLASRWCAPSSSCMAAASRSIPTSAAAPP